MTGRAAFGALQPVTDDAAYGRRCPHSGRSPAPPRTAQEGQKRSVTPLRGKPDYHVEARRGWDRLGAVDTAK